MVVREHVEEVDLRATTSTALRRYPHQDQLRQVIVVVDYASRDSLDLFCYVALRERGLLLFHSLVVLLGPLLLYAPHPLPCSRDVESVLDHLWSDPIPYCRLSRRPSAPKDMQCGFFRNK